MSHPKFLGGNNCSVQNPSNYCIKVQGGVFSTAWLSLRESMEEKQLAEPGGDDVTRQIAHLTPKINCLWLFVEKWSWVWRRNHLTKPFQTGPSKRMSFSFYVHCVTSIDVVNLRSLNLTSQLHHEFACVTRRVSSFDSPNVNLILSLDWIKVPSPALLPCQNNACHWFFIWGFWRRWTPRARI